MQLPSEEYIVTMAENGYVVMYSDGESEEQNMNTVSCGSEAIDLAEQERPSSSAETKGDLLDKENNQGDSSLPSVVTHTDNFVTSHSDGTSDKDDVLGASSDTGQTCTHALGEQQRSVNEIEVVQGFDEREKGEIVKKFLRSRHITSSGTFLSQMHFFGGRTWARGRRRRGRGWGAAITNIALKLIETDRAETDGEHSNSLDEVGPDRAETDGEHSNSLDEVGQNITVTNGVCSGMGVSSPLLQINSESVSEEESKEAVTLSSEAEQPSSLASRKAAARGRRKPQGSKGHKAKQGLTKDNSKTLSSTDNLDDKDCEFNDEDTLAAIRASLEDMNKNSNTVNINTNEDEKSITEDLEKQDATKKFNSRNKADSLKKDSKTKNSSDKKDTETEQETLLRSGRRKKAGISKNTFKRSNVDGSKKSDYKRVVRKAKGNKVRGQNITKRSRGGPPARVKRAKEANIIIEPKKDVMSESDDEDTRAAIAASLEELEKERHQKERKLENQKANEQKKGKQKSKRNTFLCLTPSQVKDEEGSSTESSRRISSASADTGTSGLHSRTRSKVFSEYSSKLSFCPEPATVKKQATKPKAFRKYSSKLSVYPEPATVKQEATSPNLQDPQSQKVENISAIGRNRIQSSVWPEGNETGNSSGISDFDNVVDSFLREETRDSMSVSSSVDPKRGKKQERKRKRVLLPSSSEAINVESDSEKSDSTVYAKRDNYHFLPDSSPVVKLEKLDPPSESSVCRKRLRDASGDDQGLASRRKNGARPSSSHHYSESAEDVNADQKNASASQYPDKLQSITVITPLDTARLPQSHGNTDCFTKSVGGMMSHLFGDKLAEECPNGFVVSVRLEVEKKNDKGDNVPNRSGTCCQTGNPALCPCLQKASDSELASLLKERIQNRRDLAITAKGTLLAAIMHFIQELEDASTNH